MFAHLDIPSEITYYNFGEKPRFFMKLIGKLFIKNIVVSKNLIKKIIELPRTLSLQTNEFLKTKNRNSSQILN